MIRERKKSVKPVIRPTRLPPSGASSEAALAFSEVAVVLEMPVPALLLPVVLPVVVVEEVKVEEDEEEEEEP